MDLSATASPGSFISHSSLSSRSDARVKSESGNQWVFFLQLFFKQFLGDIFRTNFYSLKLFTMDVKISSGSNIMFKTEHGNPCDIVNEVIMTALNMAAVSFKLKR